MVLGLALALDNFGLFQARNIFRFWPIVLVIVGVTRLRQSASARAAASRDTPSRWSASASSS
jgi:hypothetical protein